MTSQKEIWLSASPKVELHLHLEGAIPLPSLWSLIEKNGGDEVVKSLTDLEKRFQYSDFKHFVRTWLPTAEKNTLAKAVSADPAWRNSW